MVKTNYEITIGDKKFEVTYSGSGSISPWESEVIHRYGIFTMGTSDIGEFMKVNDAVYRLRVGGMLKVYDYLSTLLLALKLKNGMTAFTNGVFPVI